MELKAKDLPESTKVVVYLSDAKPNEMTSKILITASIIKTLLI